MFMVEHKHYNSYIIIVILIMCPNLDFICVIVADYQAIFKKQKYSPKREHLFMSDYKRTYIQYTYEVDLPFFFFSFLFLLVVVFLLKVEHLQIYSKWIGYIYTFTTCIQWLKNVN